MEIDLDIFRAFVDQNQPPEAINQANAIIQENIANPQLALFILNVYQTPEVQNDQIITHAMTLILFRIIDYVWTNLYPKELEQYDTNAFSQIREGIIPVCLNISPDFQPVIIESICKIIRQESYDSEDLVINACSLINPQQDFHIISIVFQILESYSDVVKIVKDINKCEPFCDTFLQIWQTIIPQLQESFSNEPQTDSFQIVKSASDIMKNLLKSATDSLVKPETYELIQFFMNTLIIQNNEDYCIQMKESVLLFFNQALILTQDEQRREYTGRIKQTFLENIFQIIPQLFPTISETNTIGALSALMNIFLAMIIYGISLEWFYSPEFAFNYLIPAARLTQSDLEEFESSPAHYIGSSICYNDEADVGSKGYDIPRLTCSKIIQIMIPVKPELFVVDLTQFSNPLDLEAFLYLIYQGYSKRKNISFAIDEGTYSQIFTLLNTPDMPEYIYPSTLCALQNNILLNNYELLKSVSSSAYEIFMNNEMNLIFVVPAMSLFRMTIPSLAKNGEFESLINIKELITRLLQVSSEINTPEVQIVMKNLIEWWNGPQIREFSRELFTPYSETLIEISKIDNSNEISSQQEDELNRITDTFYLFFKIQTELEEKYFFAEQIISLTVNILQEYPNSIGVNSLIDLCLNVCQKIDLGTASDEFKQLLVKFAHFIISYITSLSEESFNFYLFTNFASVLAALMPLIEGELLQQTQLICFNIIRNHRSIDEITLSAAILVLSNIILIHDDANIGEITQEAMELMKNSQEQLEEGDEIHFDISYTTISCIFLLTSALFKTQGSFAESIPEEILFKWFELSNVFDLHNQREIHTFVLGLLILAKLGNADAYKVAGDLLLQNFKKEMSPMFEEEEECYESADLLKIQFPLDHENVSKLFLELAEKYGPPEDSSEDFYKWLTQKASDN